jgi:hypothetical protein
MKAKINRWINACVLHEYQHREVLQVNDGMRVTLTARLCTRCGHCHSGDWHRARDAWNVALAAGFPVEVAACISREVHRPAVVLPTPWRRRGEVGVALLQVAV